MTRKTIIAVVIVMLSPALGILSGHLILEVFS
jgi:hypothetical protein